MVRLRSPHGVVVVVDEATAAALSGFAAADKSKPDAKDEPKRRAPVRNKKQ